VIDPRKTLEFLTKALRGEAIPTWCDVDVTGIALKTKSITVALGKRRLVFRQLEISDFEKEFIPSAPPLPGRQDDSFRIFTAYSESKRKRAKVGNCNWKR